jgi:hypothetical protein
MSIVTDVTLQLRDLKVLEALREDFAERGTGISRAEVERMAGTVYPHRIIKRLCAVGHCIGSVGQGEHYQLVDPLLSTEASDEAQPSATPPVAAGQSSEVSVESKLFELPTVPHYRQEAA